MKQRVASVQFSGGIKSYPVSCERKDIEAGMSVYVCLNDEQSPGALQQATVTGISYWKKDTPFKYCVACLVEEKPFDLKAVLDKDADNSDGSLACPVVSNENKNVESVSETPLPVDPPHREEPPAHLSRPELERELRLLGFGGYATVQRVWRGAYVASSDVQTLYVLTRKKGIQLRVFDHPGHFEWQGNALSLNGGRTADLHYLQADVNLHDYVLHFARYFIETGRIDEASFTKQGLAWRETQQYKDYVEERTRRLKENSSECLYSDLGGDGEPIYLSDGVWLTSGGSFKERGR